MIKISREMFFFEKFKNLMSDLGWGETSDEWLKFLDGGEGVHFKSQAADIFIWLDIYTGSWVWESRDLDDSENYDYDNGAGGWNALIRSLFRSSITDFMFKDNLKASHYYIKDTDIPKH